jgi:FtsP/CotA-like multicopper oxidase with cupredoxin domain
MLEVFRHGTHPLVDDADLVVLPGSSGGSLGAHLADHTLALLPLFLAVGWVAARLIARAGVRPVPTPAAVPPAPTPPAATAPSGDLWLPAMTRREVLRVGAVTGIALSLPFGASTARGDIPASPRFTPFTRKLVFGDPFSPSAPGAFTPTCHLDPRFGTPRLYEIDMFENEVEIIPGLGTRIFGYEGTYPGPTFRVREGEPAIVRFRNNLPVPTVIHNHGGHQSGKVGGDPNTDSDSFPDDLIRPGAFKDYCYPHAAPLGDLINADFTSTQWYHDHAVDITGPNVWAGLAGFYLLTDALEERLVATGVLPATAFDLPLALQDRRFDRTGRLVYEPEDFDGVLGDVFVVNGKAQPYVEVQRKKYRLRLLNGSNARFYQLELSNRAPFLQVGTDSWLLPFAVQRSSIRLGMAERADVIVDFRDAPAEVLLMNVLEQENGRRPGDVRRPGVPLVKFVVRDGPRENNASVAPGTVLRPHTPILPDEIVATRDFRFDRSGGRWTINGEEFDPNRDDARPRLGTAERWILRNNSGGWTHPIHIHLEAHHIERIGGRRPPPWDAFNKDTTVLDRNQEASVLIRFRTFPGRYVFHCHNIEHEDMRMMGTFNVIK